MSAATVREAIRQRIGGAWDERADGFWLFLRASDVRAAAAALKEGGGRFAALVVRPSAGTLRLSWHWDVGGTLLSVDALLAPGERPPTVTDLYPGADWAEREAREYYRVEFEGREATPPLMLREGDATGLLLRGEGDRP
jgi:hypothetical protein